MRLIEFIDTVNPVIEAFDRTTEFKLTKSTPTEVEYTFPVNNLQYSVVFYASEIDFEWDFYFSSSSSDDRVYKYKPTGTGSPMSVFSGVINVTKDFIHRHNVKQLLFSGDTGNGLSSLYNKLVPYLSKKLNFKYTIEHSGYVNYYIINIDDSLSEAFDSSENFKTVNNRKGVEYQFVSNGDTYFVEFFNNDASWEYTVDFGNKSNGPPYFKPTGTGLPMSVFSTVINVIKDFISKHDEVTELVFSGNNSTGLSKLYNKMVPYLSKKLNFGYDRNDNGTNTDYILYLYRDTKVLSEAPKPWLRQTDTMRRQAKGLKSQVIVEMSPEEFLLMTTSSQSQRRDIMNNAKSLQDYNRWAKAGDDDDFNKRINQGKTSDDDDYVWGSIHMPWLTIKLSDGGKHGKVVGHEGRHRAAALINSGVDKIQVALQMRPSEDMLPNVLGKIYYLNSEHIPDKIEGQYSETPYDTTNWKIIKDNMQGRTLK